MPEDRVLREDVARILLERPELPLAAQANRIRERLGDKLQRRVGTRPKDIDLVIDDLGSYAHLLTEEARQGEVNGHGNNPR